MINEDTFISKVSSFVYTDYTAGFYLPQSLSRLNLSSKSAFSPTLGTSGYHFVTF